MENFKAHGSGHAGKANAGHIEIVRWQGTHEASAHMSICPEHMRILSRDIEKAHGARQTEKSNAGHILVERVHLLGTFRKSMEHTEST